MTRTATLLRLMQTADSAFPSGAFAFSNGLETLAAEGVVPDRIPLATVLLDQIAPRWIEFDRYFVRAAVLAEDIAAIDRDCDLRQTVPELCAASQRMGRALLTSHARIGTAGAAAYLARPRVEAPAHAPVVQGLVGRVLELTPEEAEAGAFHGLLAGFSAAAVRLGKIGAISAQELVAQAIAHHAPAFETAPEAPSAFAPIADIAAQRRDAAAVNLFAT
ncbi:MAG: urease accessory UreF family protein [Pseudomonadota bacterium]